MVNRIGFPFFPHAAVRPRLDPHNGLGLRLSDGFSGYRASRQPTARPA